MRQISFNCSYLSHAGILYQIPGNLERPLEVNISFWTLFNRILNTALLFFQILQNKEILPRSVLSNVGGTLCTGILATVCNTLLSVLYGPSNDRNEVTKYWDAINYFQFFLIKTIWNHSRLCSRFFYPIRRADPQPTRQGVILESQGLFLFPDLLLLLHLSIHFTLAAALWSRD